MEQRCGNCRFWDIWWTKLNQECSFADGDRELGYCRRSPPVFMLKDSLRVIKDDQGVRLIEMPDVEFACGHPTTEPIDWCGEWQPAREPVKQEGTNR